MVDDVKVPQTEKIENFDVPSCRKEFRCDVLHLHWTGGGELRGETMYVWLLPEDSSAASRSSSCPGECNCTECCQAGLDLIQPCECSVAADFTAVIGKECQL